MNLATKEKIILFVLIFTSSLASTLITKDFLIRYSAEKGLFFTSIIFLNKVDFSTSNILWSMPLSQLIYSFVSTLETKYLSLYVFICYLFCYLFLFSVVKALKSNIKQLFLLFLLIIYHIITFQNFDLEQLFYSTYLILTAFYFYIKEEKNNIKNILFLSLLIASSFLIRTTLLIIPIILFVYEILNYKDIKKAVLILFLPYLLAFTPYMILSYTLTEKIQIIEFDRLRLNLFTSFYSLTHTAEVNIETLTEVLKNFNNTFNLAIFFKTIFKRFMFFIKNYHVFFFTSIIIIIKYRNKFNTILLYLTSIFLIIHLTTSVEKRYLFPLGLIFATIVSTASLKTTNKLDFFENKIFLISFIPLVFIYIITIRYALLTKEYNNRPNVLNLILAIENLYNLEREKSINYIETYLSKGNYFYTQHINEVMEIIKTKDKKIITQDKKTPPLLFNTDFIKFLKLVYITEKEEALKYLEKKWPEISNSYLRNPTNEIETQLNIELNNYIKENFMTFPSFIIVVKNIDDFFKLCEEVNSILTKANKKHKFKCIYPPNIISIPYDKYIVNNCLKKNYTKTIQKTIFEVIELENRKEFEKAIKLIDENLNTKIYKFYSEKGNILYTQAKYEDALINYSKALELCECAADAIYGKINTLSKLSKNDEKKLFKENIKKKCKFIITEEK